MSRVPVAAGEAHLPGHRASRAPDGRRPALAPGELRVLLASGQLRRRRQRGLFAGTIPGANDDFDFPRSWHNGYGRLYLDRPHRFRFDGYWVSPWRLAVGLQAFVESGAPLNRLGYFSGRLRLGRPARCPAAPRAGCRRSGTPI